MDIAFILLTVFIAWQMLRVRYQRAIWPGCGWRSTWRR